MSLAMLLLAVSATSATPQPNQCETMFGGDVEKIREHIWHKEMSIYQGRSNGDMSYYLSNTSDHFLAWASGKKDPYDKASLQKRSESMKGKTQEVITTTPKGFTVSGNTAVIYYLNHRTRTADGRNVDQHYDNIHVWLNENCRWNLIASMSRASESGSSKHITN